jgi:predicted nucleotidyltransferase
MDRSTVLENLRAQAPLLRAQFGLRRIALFGSAARDELRADSDIDVLVDFAEPPTMTRYFDTQDALEALLGRPVDLVTSAGLKPRARAQVERDLIDVA